MKIKILFLWFIILVTKNYMGLKDDEDSLITRQATAPDEAKKDTSKQDTYERDTAKQHTDEKNTAKEDTEEKFYDCLEPSYFTRQVTEQDTTDKFYDCLEPSYYPFEPNKNDGTKENLPKEQFTKFCDQVDLQHIWEEEGSTPPDKDCLRLISALNKEFNGNEERTPSSINQAISGDFRQFISNKTHAEKQLNALKGKFQCEANKDTICGVSYDVFTQNIDPKKPNIVLPSYEKQYKEAMQKMNQNKNKLTAHFIIGLSSTGKSTMTNSIVHLINENNPNKLVYTLDGDDFRQEHPLYQQYMEFSRNFVCSTQRKSDQGKRCAYAFWNTNEFSKTKKEYFKGVLNLAEEKKGHLIIPEVPGNESSTMKKLLKNPNYQIYIWNIKVDKFDLPKIQEAGENRAKESGKSYDPDGAIRRYFAYNWPKFSSTVKGWFGYESNKLIKLTDIKYEYMKKVETQVKVMESNKLKNELAKYGLEIQPLTDQSLKAIPNLYLLRAKDGNKIRLAKFKEAETFVNDFVEHADDEEIPIERFDTCLGPIEPIRGGITRMPTTYFD